MNHANRFYLFITISLVIAVITGGVILITKHNKSQSIKITLSQASLPQQSGEVYIGGAIANPGLYPLGENDTIQTLLSITGPESDADLSHIKIYIPHEGEEQLHQKVDINRADPWLLVAVPGIGNVLGQRIIHYRSENGPFKRIEGLLKVDGIGEGTFNEIKGYITVSD
ncbi:MAG: helix-hairpin-helix domain-containing protein [Dehalococcoidia bacterium]|nr:helix-hairpin-helix domain-containing protein [Dehalococcoidia bacterium]